MEEQKRKVRHIGVGAPSSDIHHAGSAAEAPSEAAKKAADKAYAHQQEREQQEAKKSAPAKPTAYKKKGGGFITTKNIIIISLAVLLIAGVGLIWNYIHKLQNDPGAFFEEQPTPAVSTPLPVKTPEVEAASTFEPSPEPTIDPAQMLLSAADLEFMKNRVNILVLGLDESTERANWGSFRTDTMILVSIDFGTRDVHMVSIPRDSYVKICDASGKPTGSFGKVNSAFPAGGGAQKKGYQFSMGTVSYLLGGIPISHYVGFNMNVVKEVVNAMDGVDYDVDIEVLMNGRELHPGMQHLDGQGVLDYCRQRKGSSDIARVDRQQRMIMAIFAQMKSRDQLSNIPYIYEAVADNIQTSLSFSQICALALMAMDMDLEQLQRYTVDGEFMNIHETSYWGLSTNKIKGMVKQVFGVDVNIDSDIAAANVRKRVEEELALISGELGAARSAIKTTDMIFSKYGAWIDANTLSRLDTLKTSLEDALETGDKALLDAYTDSLRKLNNAILQKLKEAGANVEPEPEPQAVDTQEPPQENADIENETLETPAG